MATEDPTDPTETETVGPAMLSLARSVDALRIKRGWSRRKLALQSGVEVTHMSHFLNGKKGMRVDKLWRVAQALGGVLAVDEDGDPAGIVGTIGAQGELHTEVSAVSFPALFEVVEGFGPFQVGDRVLIQPSDRWEVGKYLVVESSGRQRLVKAVDHQGLRALVTSEGDVMVFQPSRHVIVGKATERTPAPELL